MAEDEYERTLCQLPQCHVFKIPVRSSAAGHRASDWPQDPQWTGKVKIVAKGKTAAIFLINANDDRVFACCPVTDDAAVERCVDSGRYFVLRITNPQGKHAFIGIAFNERNDAFDFNVALSEHKASVEREEAPIQVAASLGDMSIAQGEKIKLKNITAASPRKKPSGGGGAFLLAPPPRDSHIKQGATYGGGAPGAVQRRPGHQSQGNGSSTADDLLSMSAPAPTPTLAPVTDTFGGSGSDSTSGTGFAASSSSSGGGSFDSFSPAPATPAADNVFAGFDAAPPVPIAAPLTVGGVFVGSEEPTMLAPAVPLPAAPLASAFASPSGSSGGVVPTLTPGSAGGMVGQGFSPMPAPVTPEDPFAGFGGNNNPSPGTMNSNFNAMGGVMSAAPSAPLAANVFDSFSSPTPPHQAQAQAQAPRAGGSSLLDF